MRIRTTVTLAIVVSFSVAATQSRGVQGLPPGPSNGNAESASIFLAQALAVWRSTGRMYVESESGLHWNDTDSDWTVDSNWAEANNAGASAYFLEPTFRGVLALGESGHDPELYDEVAKFYLRYLARFVTVADIAKAQAAIHGSRAPKPQGDPSSLTLPWIDHRGPWPSECALCNAQALHPASKLLRLIAGLPVEKRTPAMIRFVALYRTLLVNDHLLRWAYQVQWSGSAAYSPGHLVTLWEQAGAGREGVRYRVLDRDLWLIATGAEMLEAQRLDSTDVNLASAAPSLRRLVVAGMKLLRSQTTSHPSTRDWAGRTVGSLGYFEGEFDQDADMVYIGDTGSVYPDLSNLRPARNGSWDMSHIQRLPVVLRSLWDARQALGDAAPSKSMLVETVNQYLYVAFQGDLHRPRFNNLFDGEDGWYRAGYSGRAGWGYPPSRYCDSRIASRPCLAHGAVAGWGLLAFVSPDLARLGAGLVSLTRDSSANAVEFRLRNFSSGSDRFSWCGELGSPCSLLLGEIIGEFGPNVIASAGP